MNIAFIRSIEIQQAIPYLPAIEPALRASGATAKLFYTDGDCSPADFPGEAAKLPADVTPAALAAAIRDWGADAAASLSIPDENAIRDALVKDELAAVGIRMIAHSPKTASIFANKWATKQLLAQYDIATAPGLFVDGDLLNGRGVPVPAYHTYIRTQCAELGYPVLCKPLWDCLGNGITYLHSQADLDAYLAQPFNGNIVIEKCLFGSLIAIEILGLERRYIFQPSIWKGETKAAPPVAFTRVGRNPCVPADARNLAQLKEKLLKLCCDLNVCGALEVEMIYQDGVFHVLEVNPRVSGSTSMFIASSGFNTYVALLSMALGTWHQRADAYGGRQSFALQFPYLRKRAPVVADGAVNVVRASTFHIGGIDRPNAIISCDPSKIETVPAWIKSAFDMHPDVNQEIESVCRASLRNWAAIAAAEFS